VRVFPKTPRRPACDSGMDVPGIRHNAECKRKRVAFEASEIPLRCQMLCLMLQDRDLR